jgi:hypothetical protein
MDKQVFLWYTGSESLRHVPRSCKEGLYDSSYFQFFLRNLHTNSTVAKLIYTLTSSEWGCLLPGASHRIHLFSLGCSQGSSHLHAPAGYRHWAPRSTWWRLISSVLLCFIFPQIAGLGGGESKSCESIPFPTAPAVLSRLSRPATQARPCFS